MDIVERLRNVADEGYRFAGEAADEIERLREMIEAAKREEREECAEACDRQVALQMQTGADDSVIAQAMRCADAIRARRNNR